MSSYNRHIADAQRPLLRALSQAARGVLSADKVKPFGAPLGVYPQRNGLFMARIRVTGGYVGTEDRLRFLASVAVESGAGFVRFTSRQDLQLHDLSAEGASLVVRKCTRNGFPFRGGGGDTFRNVLVAPQAFALVPYAVALSDAVFSWDDAFALPRKLKIAFAFDSDPSSALRQDLGFVARTLKDGSLRFSVFGGGGLGRNHSFAVKLLSSVRSEDIATVVRAMVEFFAEQGDRTNRSRARIRFIKERLGEKRFVALWRRYYRSQTKIPFPQISPGGAAPTLELFPPDGKLTSRQFERLAARVRGRTVFTPNSTLLVDNFERLGSFKPDLRLKSLEGRLSTCVGASVCKIGILDTPKYAREVAKALAWVPEERFGDVLRMIRLSGCPNSCSAHQAVRYGFQGGRLNGEDVFTVFLDGVQNRIIPEHDLPEFISRRMHDELS